MAIITMFFRIKIFILIIWVAICSFVFSNAGSNILYVAAIIYAVAGFIIFWLIKASFLYKQLKVARVSSRHFYFLICEVFAFLFPVALAYIGFFAYIRFSLSEQALMSYVKDVKNGKVDLNFEFTHPDRIVGLYRVSYTDILSDGTVRVITSPDGLFDAAGFTYSYRTPPPRAGEDSYKPIKRNWWYWRRSW